MKAINKIDVIKLGLKLLREGWNVIFNHSVGHEVWLDLVHMGVSVVHAVEEEMVGCLRSATTTNLLTEFFLLHKHGHIINSLRELAVTSKHLCTHSSFDANRLFTLVGNLRHNISDRLWFPNTRCDIVVRLEFRFVD